VPWGQVIESRIQQLHVRALPGDRESKPPRPDGLSTASEVQVTDSSPKHSPEARQHEEESDRADLLVAPAPGATCDQTLLTAALDAVLLDLKAADA